MSKHVLIAFKFIDTKWLLSPEEEAEYYRLRDATTFGEWDSEEFRVWFRFMDRMNAKYERKRFRYPRKG